MTVPANNLIGQISYHHHQASLKAAEAIFHAKEAGRLLIEVKATLAHGEFGKWMENNLKVTPRQAQRYMQTAQGKKPDQVEAKKAKSDAMSHLPAKRVKKLRPPLWEPKAGFSYSGVWDGWTYFIQPARDAAQFHITLMKADRTTLEEGDERLDDETNLLTDTVPTNMVEVTLQGFGLAEPGKLWWSVMRSEGTTMPFGVF